MDWLVKMDRYYTFEFDYHHESETCVGCRGKLETKTLCQTPYGCCMATLHLGTDPGAEVLGAVDTGIVAGRVAVVDTVGTDPGAKVLAITE